MAATVVNPVSFYYCFDADDRRLEAVVAEVITPPGGEQHCYVLDGPVGVANGEQWAPRSQRQGDARLAVFHPMSLDYQWGFRIPAEQLAVRWASRRAARRMRLRTVVFDATLVMQRVPISPRHLRQRSFAFAHDASGHLGIHWQALRLWRKGVPCARSHQPRTRSSQRPTQ
jgi:DUF1365 family protein